ncbi:hypothetical protein [Clostridium ihumii]|uniref:hypothetical protein n=1 Tax=Clostridium ihumii TaxID=1470356 RepID=UPI00058BE727|nr:hypothetical protein [Clostridium ihumii]
MKVNIPKEVKENVYKVTDEVLEEFKIVDIEKIQTLLKENYGVWFFNSIALEKLIKEFLDKKIFIYC